jgi:hypothetical protein
MIGFGQLLLIELVFAFYLVAHKFVLLFTQEPLLARWLEQLLLELVKYACKWIIIVMLIDLVFSEKGI